MYCHYVANSVAAPTLESVSAYSDTLDIFPSLKLVTLDILKREAWFKKIII